MEPTTAIRTISIAFMGLTLTSAVTSAQPIMNENPAAECAEFTQGTVASPGGKPASAPTVTLPDVSTESGSDTDPAPPDPGAGPGTVSYSDIEFGKPTTNTPKDAPQWWNPCDN